MKGFLVYHVNEVAWRIYTRGLHYYVEGTNGQRLMDVSLDRLFLIMDKIDKFGEEIQ